MPLSAPWSINLHPSISVSKTACLRDIICGVALESSTTSHDCRRPTTIDGDEKWTSCGCDGPASEHLGCRTKCPLHAQVQAALCWGNGCAICVHSKDSEGAASGDAVTIRLFGVCSAGSKFCVTKLDRPVAAAGTLLFAFLCSTSLMLGPAGALLFKDDDPASGARIPFASTLRLSSVVRLSRIFFSS